MLSNLIEAGNKIDIQMLNRAELSSKMIEAPKVFKSQIIDIMENGDIEILMPTEGGKLLLLSLGMRYEFIFYTQTGLYKAVGEIKERYKSDNKFLILVTFHTPLSKYQRREYFRLEYIMDISFFVISKKMAEIDSAEEMVEKLNEKLNDDTSEEKEKKYTANVIDISGGGLRLRIDHEFEDKIFLLLFIKLGKEDFALEYPVLGHVISCDKVEEVFGKYELRVEFVFKDKDSKVREEIIKFIFAEQRKKRNNSKG